MKPRIVISASRRTDIPAFYMDWFMSRIDAGFFELTNPYNGRTTRIAASPDDVHTIVFWSKDFSRFIEDGHGKQLMRRGYHLFFNFTINSESLLLEPKVSPLKNRFQQAAVLCETFGPETVQWRFDPVCFFSFSNGPVQNNLDDFSVIAHRLSSLGIRRCITSFMDHYAKIARRCLRIPGFNFTDPPVNEKIEILLGMQSVIAANGMELYTCCEKEVLEGLSDDANIRAGSCIPHPLLVKLFGGELSFKKDVGQRVRQGCGCFESKDIGTYSRQPCYHNCLFCYANPCADGESAYP